MAARGSVGTGYIDVVPRLGSDWGRELTRRMQEGAGPAGDQSGQEAGGRFFSGFLGRFREGPFRTLGGTIGKGIAAGAAAVAGLGIGKLLADSVAGASDLNETVSKIGVVFGDAAAGVLEFGRTAATSLGQSRQQALEAAGTMGNLFVSMGLGEQKAAAMSTSMVKLATDFASFNNASPEEALDAIKAALIGENDPIQRFGVLLNAAAIKAEALRLGLIRGKEAVTPAIQAQAAYSLILAQSGTAQGDFARTSGGLANQQRILKARLQDLSANLGSVFLPVVTNVVDKLAGFVGAIPRIAGEIGGKLAPAFDAAKLGLSAFVTAVREGGDVTSGGFVGAMQTLGGAIHDLAPRALDLGKSIGEKLLPPLKDLGSFIAESVWPSVKNLADVFKNTLLPDLGSVSGLVGGALLLGFQALSAILKDVVGPAVEKITGFVKDFQVALASLAVTIGVFTFLMNAHTLSIYAGVIALEAWTIAVNIAKIAALSLQIAVLLVGKAFLANPIGIIVVALIALAAGFAYAWKHSETFRKIVKAALHAVVAALEAIGNFVSKNWPVIVSVLTLGLFDAVKWIIRHWDGIKHAFSKAIDWVKGFVGKWWPYMLGLITGGIGLAVVWVIRHWDDIKHAFSVAVDWVKGFVQKWWPFILGIMTGGIGLAVGMIIRHWDGIKNAFSSAIDWCKGVVSRGINAITGPFEAGLRAMERIANTIWGHIKAAFSNPIDFIKGLISGFDHIVNNITGAIGLGRPLPEKFERGGRLKGYGGGDRRLILAEDGETIVPKHLTPEIAGWAKARGIPGFAGGGFLGGVWHAVTNPLDTIKGAGEWVLDKAAHLLREGAAAALSAALAGPRGLLRLFMGRDLPWKMPATATDHGLTGLIDWIRGKESAGGGGGSPGTDTARKAMAIVQAMAASMYGWVGAQWSALKNLLMGESGFNPFAVNRSSGAAGIFQSLGHGPVPLGNATAQAQWGLPYIKGRYNTPINAYAMWLSRHPHWYDAGGGVAWPSGSVGVNTSGETEYVWRASQLRAGGRDVHVHFHGGTFVGTDKARFGREMRDMLRDSLRGDGRHEAAGML